MFQVVSLENEKIRCAFMRRDFSYDNGLNIRFSWPTIPDICDVNQNQLLSIILDVKLSKRGGVVYINKLVKNIYKNIN